jgi:hypothetical protein
MHPSILNEIAKAQLADRHRQDQRDALARAVGRGRRADTTAQASRPAAPGRCGAPGAHRAGRQPMTGVPPPSRTPVLPLACRPGPMPPPPTIGRPQALATHPPNPHHPEVVMNQTHRIASLLAVLAAAAGIPLKSGRLV